MRSPASVRRALLPALVATACLALAPARPSAPAPAEGPLTLSGLLLRLEASWRARDLSTYLGLWASDARGLVAEERYRVAELFAGQECSVQLGRVAPAAGDAALLHLHMRTFCVHEPSGHLMTSRYTLRSLPEGWRVVSRDTRGPMERFVHLTLSPQGFRADGRTLRLEDFELRMERGTIFMPPESVGPTALVFVGAGTVRFTPRPAAEQEQLRTYCGQRELVARIKTATVRLDPEDLDQLLGSSPWTPDPDSPQRLRVAQDAFERQGAESYRLETSLPGSPWWTYPLPGKAVVAFGARHTTLVFSVTAQPEALALFDRSRRVYVCMYPKSDDTTHYYEDEANGVDILHHDLKLRLDPDRLGFEGEDTLRLRLHSETANVYLRLSGDLAVRSVTSPLWGDHLFFRSTRQNLLVVALAGLPRAEDELTLTVNYGGTLQPAHADDERGATPEEGQTQLAREVDANAPKVYSNDPIWYPQTIFTDYATAHIVVDVPADYNVVSGGQRVSARVDNKRLAVEYRQDSPSRYVSLIVGRLSEAGQSAHGSVQLRGYGMAMTRGQVPDLLEESARIIQFFETRFGRCPYPTLNVVLTETRTPGGHSPPGMAMLSRRSLRLKRLSSSDPADFSDFPGFFIAHEIAHQWWGHGVAPANYRERWLSEAQAHYAAALWVQHALGDKAFHRALDWMAYWARRESDRGPINLGQRLGHVQGDARIYRAVVYDKGALVLHMLRGLMGDAAFFDGLKRFQEDYRFRTATTDDLRQEWQTTSGRDLAAYFDSWVGGTELPRLRWSHEIEHTAQGWRTTLKIAAEHLPGALPLSIAAEWPGSVERAHVLLAAEGGSYALDTRERPTRVRINDDRGLLARVKRGS